jgi:hypothetical protein
LAVFEIYLLVGIALGIIALVRIFSSAVDGTRPTFSVIILFVAIASVWYSNRLSGEPLGINTVKTALVNLFAEITG